MKKRELLLMIDRLQQQVDDLSARLCRLEMAQIPDGNPWIGQDDMSDWITTSADVPADRSKIHCPPKSGDQAKAR